MTFGKVFFGGRIERAGKAGSASRSGDCGTSGVKKTGGIDCCIRENTNFVLYNNKIIKRISTNHNSNEN